MSRRAFLNAAVLAAGPGLIRDPGLPFPVEPEVERSRGARTSPPERFDPWVEVIPDHIRENLRTVRRLARERPVLAVVKNNGYGLGLEETGRILQDEPGLAGFAVVKGEEALRLRASGVRKPILLMGMFEPEAGAELAKAGVDFGTFTDDALERLLPLARDADRAVGVHIYLDTGMGRMGMPYRRALPWMEELARHPQIEIHGVFTELGEDPDFDPEQLHRFSSVVEAARGAGMDPGTLHAAASNGVFHLTEGHLDMVRPGIALFGSYPSDPAREREMATLRSAVRLKARVVRLSRLAPGDGVGYGRPWIAQQPTWVATLPVGHADGYPREAPGGARVLIRGDLFPVIGGVSASHSIVDIGEEPSVEVGDEATLMGPDHPSLEPNFLAETLGVSVYDLLMHLNPAMPRILVDG
jgi:alanine racemase